MKIWRDLLLLLGIWRRAYMPIDHPTLWLNRVMDWAGRRYLHAMALTILGGIGLAVLTYLIFGDVEREVPREKNGRWICGAASGGLIECSAYLPRDEVSPKSCMRSNVRQLLSKELERICPFGQISSVNFETVTTEQIALHRIFPTPHPPPAVRRNSLLSSARLETAVPVGETVASARR